ncbi:hypothetical protein VNO78_22169 [Psophocarpus tetragonolobus]|uniref:Uncharacterized protein n=1 Tax=Psophocarpus tetragonolobus TaxID=3891 RepID=A0AAN9SCU4_PSOTE
MPKAEVIEECSLPYGGYSNPLVIMKFQGTSLSVRIEHGEKEDHFDKRKLARVMKNEINIVVGATVFFRVARVKA